MPSDLLHQVRLCDLSPDGREQLKQLLREVLLEGVTQPATMRPEQAWAYLGISKSRFYKLIREDAHLKAASFRVGAARLWPREALDAWIKVQAEKQTKAPARSSEVKSEIIL